MAFKQVKDLIEWIVQYHETLEHQYQSLAAAQSDERMRMALDSLAHREHRMAEGMEDFLQDSDDALMEGWLVDSQAFDTARVSDQIPKCHGCHSVQEILDNVLEAHRTLQELYEHRSKLAQHPREAELFRDLADYQQVEARLQSRDIGRLEMY